jgi:uncharacterized beta-barrel protein YwiB (DUF1934 family)
MVRILIFLCVLPSWGWSATSAELDRLHAALDSRALMDILSEEGIAQSEDLRSDMFPGRGGAGWTVSVRQIYDPERLFSTFRKAFDAEMAEAAIDELLAFYYTDTGAHIAELEVDARRAIMSEEVEDAAKRAYENLLETGTERLALLEEFADVNGLIDRNVAGALNSNLQFFKGLASVGSFEMTENDMLSEVWSQEQSIREDTEQWVFGYMTFAYETVSSAELRTYIDMTATRQGRALNRALFAGFDAVFQGVSYRLGEATAQFSMGDEL